MRDNRLAIAARCSSAERTTSSRRRCSTSISVIARSLQALQRLLVALEHRDRLLQDRMALARLQQDVAAAADPRDEEDGRADAEDQRPVLLRGEERERADAQEQAEREEVERGHRDQQEPHEPRLLLGELDRGELEARAHGAQPRRRDSPHVADDAGHLADHARSFQRRAMRKPISAPIPALMPTARQGFARTYSSVVLIATFAPSWTLCCSSVSVWCAASICACIFARISPILSEPVSWTVFSRSCASETTFWMSRATGFGWLVLRMAISFVNLVCESAFRREPDVVLHVLHALHRA